MQLEFINLTLPDLQASMYHQDECRIQGINVFYRMISPKHAWENLELIEHSMGNSDRTIQDSEKNMFKHKSTTYFYSFTRWFSIVSLV